MTDLTKTVDTLDRALERAASTDRGITLVDRDLDERRLSYAELAAAAGRAAGDLGRAGIVPGDRVCLLGPTTPDMLVSLFGAWIAGAVPSMLSLPRRLSEIDDLVAEVVNRIDHTGAAALVASPLLLDQVPDLDLPTPVIPLDELGVGTPAPGASIRPDDLAYLQFTSGTTARSRAVELTHTHLVANLHAAGDMVGIDPERDVFVSWLPLFHDMGLIGMLLGSVVFTTELVLEPTEEFLGRPGSWIDAISRYRGTITASPNFGYGLAARDLVAKPRALDLSAWRIAANGAEPIDLPTVERFTAEAAPYGFDDRAMCPMFGLAEATLAVTLARPDEPVHVEWVDRDSLEADGEVRWTPPHTDGARGLVACGYPIPGHEVAIVDTDEQRLAPGRVGEICVKGPSVMRGYWRAPEASDEVLSDEWLHTGDLGFWGPRGLVVCGRLKDMIIIGGRNLYPEDYELHTEDVDGVRKGNVIAFALPEQERMVVVAETTVEPAEADGVARSALERLRSKLARGPEEVVVVSPGTLPKTSSGKRQRGECRKLYAAGGLSPLAVARR